MSDFHAADVRYHSDCRQRFTSGKPLSGFNTNVHEGQLDDIPLINLIQLMRENKSRIWNASELFKTYTDLDGSSLTRRVLVKELVNQFGDEIVVLSSEGISDIIAFRDMASKTLRISNEPEDDRDYIISKASKHINQELKNIDLDSSHYSIHVDMEQCMDTISKFILDLLANVSPKLDKTLPAVLIGSIVTCICKNQPTSLQVALAVKMGESKALIDDMYSYGVTCSYSEMRRLKKSSAKASVEDKNLSGLSSSDAGLVQAVADNFDVDINSQNGKSSTHSLAVLLTLPQTAEIVDDKSLKIRRLSKEEMSEPIDYDVNIHRFNGKKNPNMPAQRALKGVLPLKLLAQQQIAKVHASKADMAFLEDVIKKDKCPEYNGYNTARVRNQGYPLKPKTKATYQPLIDMKPSDPDTMMTAMVRAQQLTFDTGQRFLVLTCDQQLYRVAVDVYWTYPERFPDVVLRLGGMHALMSFVGSIGTLMAETGLVELMTPVFGGVGKMLSGKKFPQNVRALRLVTEEILRNTVTDHHFASTEDLIHTLDEIAKQSKTAKLWIDVLIKPVLLMMNFIRAEREGDWLLHLATFRDMIPFYFAAGHMNYARYGLYYLRSMEKLPPHILSHFLKGEHVMHHIQGIWNGVWSDLFIESTFMRYGHSKGGIVGITLKPEALKVWALSRHLCAELLSSLTDMEEGEDKTQTKVTHKEEGKARIEADAKDRDGIRTKLEMCIDPIDPANHPEGIVNIVTGKIGKAEVNVQNSPHIGKEQMEAFERKWPEGFHGSIPKKVVTMSMGKQGVLVGDNKITDLNAIYARVIGLLSSSREIDIKHVLSHELAPVPTSMFTTDGMRIATNKSQLKKILQVEASCRKTDKTKVMVIDGSALLWVIHWPEAGTVADYVSNVKECIKRLLKDYEVFLIFDRYRDYSTKSVTRGGREAGASRVFHLKLKTALPAQKIGLTVTENKKQIIQIIYDELSQDRIFHSDSTSIHKLVITAESNTPLEIQNDEIRRCHELTTNHEEADNIIVQQVLHCSKEGKSITVMSDDTDVFVLLVHYYDQTDLKVPVIMESPVKGRTVIDIGETAKKHQMIAKNLLPAHALSGCDTVATYFGIGKGTVLRVLRAGHTLSAVGDVRADLADVYKQATTFISACYGRKNAVDMSQARVQLWAAKNGKGVTSSPKLCSLPPTNEAFFENVKRAHYQAILWRSLQENNPPPLDPEEYGWIKEETTKTLTPVILPENAICAPEYILRLMKCGCSGDPPCSRKCSCKDVVHLPCTMFCACYSIGCSRDG